MKRKIIITLSALNFIAFILLAITYFFGFDVQWGFTASTLVWGLPVLIISLFVLIAGVLSWKRVSWKWGSTGLALAIAAFVYICILFNSYSYVLLPTLAPHENLSIEDKILSQAVSDRLGTQSDVKENHYTVVYSDTSMPFIDIVKKTSTIKEFSDKYGYDFTNLLNRLVEINQESTRLNVDSSVHDGYYIDYDGVFSRYVTNDEYSGWLRLQMFHPQVWGFSSISLPAYDSESGYVLIYVGNRMNSITHYSSGGDIAIYRYIDGELTFLDYMIMWVG